MTRRSGELNGAMPASCEREGNAPPCRVACISSAAKPRLDNLLLRNGTQTSAEPRRI